MRTACLLALFLSAPPVAGATEPSPSPEAATPSAKGGTSRRGQKKGTKRGGQTPAPTSKPVAPVPQPAPPARPVNRPEARPAPIQRPQPSVTPATPRKPAPPISATEVRRSAVRPQPAPTAATRPFEPRQTSVRPPPSPVPVRDAPARPPRLERRDALVVRTYPSAPRPAPVYITYRPWYTHWYVHPYWRYLHPTVVVVSFPFVVYAWDPVWVPPPRPGWVWVRGYWAWGIWYPGYWRPVAPPPVRASMHYLWVPGWWCADVYVEGWWRPEHRSGWEWVAGTYLDDGIYTSGYWSPTLQGPEGYVWEPGFFDGELWVDGFWRPRFYEGHRWVSAWYDESGVRHSGYWEPLEERPGEVWIPGWFDGNLWIEGYWVSEAEYRAADPDAWSPEEPGGAVEPDGIPLPDDAPLAIPVQMDD